MKKVLGVLFVFMCILSSCTSDGMLDDNVDPSFEKPITRSIGNSILSFDNEIEYNALVDSLSMLSDEELLKWESRQSGFNSMYRVHSQVVEQVLEVQSKEEYNAIKSKYKDSFVFNDVDASDLSIYMPVLNSAKAITLNTEGHVYIAGQKRDMRDFTTFDGYYSKLAQEYPVVLNTIENGVNKVYVKTKKRKFSARIGRQGAQQAIRVNASKKILFGWVEYTTAYYWRYTPNGPIEFGKEVKSGTNIRIMGYPLPNGAKLYMWSRGVGEDNRATMTVQL